MSRTRPEQPTDAPVIRRTMAAAARELAVVETELARAREALEAALGAERRRYDERQVQQHRAAIAAFERRRLNLTDRIAALERQLPDPAAVADAERTAAAAAVRAEEAAAAFAAHWLRFLAALETAEAIGRQLLAARDDAQSAIAELEELVGAFGLRIEVALARADAAERRYGHLLGETLAELALYHSVDAVRESYLGGARREVRAMREPVPA